jgi:hypothetical protein
MPLRYIRRLGISSINLGYQDLSLWRPLKTGYTREKRREIPVPMGSRTSTREHKTRERERE